MKKLFFSFVVMVILTVGMSVSVFASEEVIDLIPEPACIEEIILQLQAQNRGRSGADNDELELILEILTEAKMNGESIYVARFYLIHDPEEEEEPVIGMRNPQTFWYTRVEALMLRENVIWQIVNITPGRHTRINSAAARIYTQLATGQWQVRHRDNLTNRELSFNQQALLNVRWTGWVRSEFNITENGHTFPVMRVFSPWAGVISR